MLNEYVAINKDKTAYQIIDGEAVVVNLEDSTFHVQNQVATFIWELMDGKITINEIVKGICREFDVDPGTAERDCLEFIRMLHDRDMVIFSSRPVDDNDT